MFCTNCGNKMDDGDRFCARCGTEAGSTGTPIPSQSDQLPDLAAWQDSIDYRLVLNHPKVIDLIRTATDQNPGDMSADEFFTSAKPILAAAGAGSVPLQLVAELVVPVYSKLGVKTGKQDSREFSLPPGSVLAALFCSFASRGQPLTSGDQAEDGCVLTARMPSSMWSWKGQIMVTIEQRPASTLVGVDLSIPGQYFDWGKSRRTLQELLDDIPRFESLQP